MALVAVALIVAGIAYGMNRGMHKLFSGALDTRSQQIAAAISDTAYGLNLKYAFHAKIRDTLRLGGMSDVAENLKPLGIKYPEHFTDTKLWNDLLQKAAHLDGISKSVGFSAKTLDFMTAEDVGLVDYYKLSFRLFGYNVQGFFYTYFVLLGISVALAIVAFWPRPGILVGMNLLLFGLFLTICRIDDVDSVANGRFLATLSVVAVFHLAVLIWAPPRMAIRTVATTVLQVSYLAFVLTVRNSAMWGVLFLLALIAISAIRKGGPLWAVEPLKSFVRKIVAWPAVVVVLGLGIAGAYHKATIHPVYFALDELFPEHLFWHAVARGLGYLDDIDSRIPGLDGRREDALPTYLANAYMKRIIGIEPERFISYYSSSHFPHLGRMRSYERLVREAYLDFARQYPIAMLRLTFVIKPMDLLRLTYTSFLATVSKDGKYVAIAFSVLLLGLAIVNPRRRYKSEVNLGLKIIGGMAAASTLPSIVAYPAHFGDAFAVFVAGGVALGLAATINLESKAVRSILRH